MDLNDVERVNFTARGGADNITVNDLTGTDVTQVNIDLSGVPGTGVGDGQSDTVTINATNGADVISDRWRQQWDQHFGAGFAGQHHGLRDGSRPPRINGLAGDDVIQGSGLAAAVPFTADGGDGDDF